MMTVSKIMLAGIAIAATSGFAQAQRQGNALIQAIEMNVAEVEAGKIASTRAQNTRVKDYAAMMVKDHTQALTKLRSLQPGSSSDVRPNARHQETADQLFKMSGAQFDREYINVMVADHQEAVAFLEAQAGLSGPAASSSKEDVPQDLAKASLDLLPAVRQHLQMAQQIQKGLGSVSKTGGETSTPQSGGPTEHADSNPNANPHSPNSTAK